MEKSGKRPKQPNGSRGTKDYLKKNKEAVDAFLNKRTPAFR